MPRRIVDIVMSSVLGRSLALAFGGLAAGLGLVLALFGGDLRERWNGPAQEGGQTQGGGQARHAPGEPPSATVPAAARPDAPVPAPGGSAAAAPVPPSVVPPSFDVVRVEPNGESVVAGRGSPGATVELLVDGRPVAWARADRDGQFAIVPPPLPPGSSEIVLRTIGPDGREIRSAQSVAVAVSREAKPLVALSAPDKPTVVLSQPAPAKPRPDRPEGPRPTAAGSTPLRIVSVDAQEGGRLFVSGQAPAGAALRLYLNDTLVVPAQAGTDGTVTFTIGKGVRPGAYRVRIDQVDTETGKVRSRAEAPFTVPEPQPRVAARLPDPVAAPMQKPAGPPAEAGPAKVRPAGPEPRREAAQAPAARPEAAPLPARPQREAGAEPLAALARPPETPAATDRTGTRTAPAQESGSAFVAEISTARITRGDSLWQISRRAYGKGDRYTVIYDANQPQIRDPDLIYPGQIFVLPEDRGGPAAGGRKRG